jgi:hypothetical protein
MAPYRPRLSPSGCSGRRRAAEPRQRDCHKLDTPAVAAIYRLGSALPPWLGEVRADRGGIAPWRARSRARSNHVRHSLGRRHLGGARAPVPQAHVTWRGSRGIGRSLALGISALTAPWHATSQLRWAEGRSAGLWRGCHAGPCDHRPRVPPQITASDHRLRSPPHWRPCVVWLGGRGCRFAPSADLWVGCRRRYCSLRLRRYEREHGAGVLGANARGGR